MLVQEKRLREIGYYKEYNKKNKDKIARYNAYRQQHKTHTLTKKEWNKCLEYFDNSCAYCGMSMEEHKNLYKQSLHKEHVRNDGSNGIENCVPACKHCNSQKRTYLLEDWYNETNPKFERERLDKIYEWMYIESLNIENKKAS